MLERVTHIEGLDQFEDFELPNDTNPGSVQTRFEVIAEDMPFLSNQQGKLVKLNFVHVFRSWDLGRTSYERRINDEVEWNEEAGSWKVKRLVPGDIGGQPVSDIRRNPDEWNAFQRGATQNDVGTPLSVLFKNDPAKVDHYKRAGISTVERLMGLNDSDIQVVGLDARRDQDRAKSYMARVSELAPKIELATKLEEKDKQISHLSNQVADLSAKLTELLETSLEQGHIAPKKRTRRTKAQMEAEAV